MSNISVGDFTNLLSALLPPVPDARLRLAGWIAFRRPAPKLDHLNWREEHAQVREPLRRLGILMLQDEHLKGKNRLCLQLNVHTLPPKQKNAVLTPAGNRSPHLGLRQRSRPGQRNLRPRDRCTRALPTRTLSRYDLNFSRKPHDEQERSMP